MPEQRPRVFLTLQRAKASRANAAFEAQGFSAEVFPLIGIKAFSAEDVIASLDHAFLADVRGVVFTSAIAAELTADLLAHPDAPANLSARFREGQLRVVAVGEATARACRERLGVQEIAIAEGRGQRGVFEVLEALPSEESRGPWWMPCSRLASPELARRVAEELGGQMRLTALYEPAPNQQGRADLRKRLAELAGDAPTWVVFFSPSAIEAWIDGDAPEQALENLRGAKIAVAGDTTASAWKDATGREADLIGEGGGAPRLAELLGERSKRK
jgi:uroporphyrinogen-III synthase